MRRIKHNAGLGRIIKWGNRNASYVLILTLLNVRFLGFVRQELVQFFPVGSVQFGYVNLGLPVHVDTKRWNSSIIQIFKEERP